LRSASVASACRKSVPIRLRVQHRQAGAGTDGVAFVERHFSHAPGLAKGQLHLADVDVAVEAQGVSLIMVAQ
jgi:hypothetical protein